jgi:HEAT repeat protein
MRSLAAIVWARSGNLDSSLGATLAKDPDQRVRRALAGALAATPADARTDPARQQLATDTRFNVRSALISEG